MKKGIVLAILALMLASFALAAEDSAGTAKGPLLFPLGDFSNEPTQAVEVSRGDQMTFQMFGGTHAFFIKELINDNIKIVFFPEIKEGSGSKGAGSLPIKQGKALAVDVNADGRKDLLVKLHSINNETAVIIISDIREAPREGEVKETAMPTGQPVGVVPSGNKNYKNSFLVLGLVIAALLGMLVAKRFRNGEKAVEAEKPAME